jgi:2-octaprenyl-6-methoxyphenol hydroxylase
VSHPEPAAGPRADVAVIGGGPVGAAFALALRDTGLSVVLLEARAQRPDDRRALALSHGSRLILERVGAWPVQLAPTPIESIHVSQRAGFGRALLRAADAGLPALGYVVTYGRLHAALSQQLADRAQLRVRTGTEVVDIEADGPLAQLRCRSDGDESVLYAALAVVADGGGLARAAAGQSAREYVQTAVVAEVSTDLPHANRAYERFTPCGPIALLPMANGFALIWTTSPEEAGRLQTLSEPAFCAAAQAAFGARAGRFTRSSARASYPLALRVAGAPRVDRVVLLGNAAQTLHPVAGQGLNLGLRDAWQLASAVRAQPELLGTPAFVARFRRAREFDRLGTIALTDLLVTGFSNDLAPLRWLRGLGLAALDAVPPAKRLFIDRMVFGA